MASPLFSRFAYGSPWFACPELQFLCYSWINLILLAKPLTLLFYICWYIYIHTYIYICIYIYSHTQMNSFRNKYRCVCACATIHTFISYLCSLSGSESNNSPVALGIPSNQILVSNYHSTKRNQASLENDWFHGWSRENTKWAWYVF